MQAAIMSYCLQNALPQEERTLENVLKLAAEEGVPSIEPYMGGRGDEDVRKTAESIRKLANELGVALPAYGSGTRLGEIGPNRQPNMDKLKEEVEACAIMGATVVTFPVVDGQPVPPDQPKASVGVRFERMLPVLVEQTQELADHAATFNVELALLNHCFLVYLGWHQKWLAKLTERANFGACVDPGNYLHYGFQDPVEVCAELSGMAKMVRAGDVAPTPEDEIVAGFKKNGEFRPWGATRFGEGAIDQESCYRNLAQGGYKGVISLKTAGASPDGPLAAVRYSWKALSDLLDRIS